MNYFKKGTLEEIKKQFRELCKKLHPDKGGDAADFREMREEFELILSQGGVKDTTREADIQESIYKKAAEFKKSFEEAEVILEITGSWIWVSGDTYPVKDKIKERGFKFSGKKKKWYWFPNIENSKGKKRGRKSMKKIREQYGSFEIKTKGAKRLENKEEK